MTRNRLVFHVQRTRKLATTDKQAKQYKNLNRKSRGNPPAACISPEAGEGVLRVGPSLHQQATLPVEQKHRESSVQQQTSAAEMRLNLEKHF